MRSRVSWPVVWLTWMAAAVLAVSLSAAGDPIALGVTGRVNATAAIAADGPFVTVAWGGAQPDGATDVFAAVSRDGGRAFGAPVRVNDVDGDARLNGEQPPQVALVRRAGREPAIVIVWTTKGSKGTKLLQSRSDDGGRSFVAASVVPGTDAAGNRGWEAIGVETGGRVDAIWLDHRELAAGSTLAMSHHEHRSADKPDGVAMAQQSKLFFASLDGTLAPRAVTGGVCYCCKTALAFGDRGAIYAAWRHVYPGNLRDMAFTTSRDGGRTFAPPVRVSEDKWALEGCPDDGPAMVVDAQNRIHVVWPTLVTEPTGPGAERGGPSPRTSVADPTIALFYAMSTDGSRFTPRERIPTEGLPHHPRIVAGANGALTVAWDESASGTRRIAIGRGTPDDGGRLRFRREPLTGGGSGVYPALAVAGDAVVAAWAGGTGAESAIHVARVADLRRAATAR
jgi:hypothetical protein